MSNESDFVLLGFIEPKDEVGSNINTSSIWRENFIGGEPVFSPNLTVDELGRNFSQAELTCGGCEQSLAFITQMNCPVDSKPIDRVIYIFTCVNVNCKNRQWKIYRVVTEDMADDRWQMKADDCNGDNSSKGTECMEIDEAADRVIPGMPLRLCLPFKQNVAKFRAMYLTVEEEKYLIADEPKDQRDRPKDQRDKSKDQRDRPKDQRDKSKGVVVEPKGSEVYEKFLIPGTDEVANKFLKTVSKFSRQVIRYEWNGNPLLNQDVKIHPGHCTVCGSKRSFELQIMPGLICEMKPVDESVELDFGTILFFTCKNNCNRDQHVFVEESIPLNDPDSSIMPSF